MCKIKKIMESLSESTVMTKKEYVLTIAACLLGGVVLGVFFSPKKHKHTVIGSNNGNGTACDCDWDEDDMWEDDMSDEVISFK